MREYLDKQEVNKLICEWLDEYERCVICDKMKWDADSYELVGCDRDNYLHCKDFSIRCETIHDDK